LRAMYFLFNNNKQSLKKRTILVSLLALVILHAWAFSMQQQPEKGSRLYTRPHPTNANVADVYAVDDDDDDVNIFDQDSRSSPKRTRDNEYADLIESSLNGPNVLKRHQSPEHIDAPVTTAGFNNNNNLPDPDQDKPPEPQGQTYATSAGKDAKGTFLHDWYAGTPYDQFNFEALKRHLQRKAEFLTNPVIQFVSDVAVKTGSSLEQMVVNAERPLVNVGASNVRDLMEGSRMSRDMLIPILALVLVEVLGQSPVEKKKETEVKLMPVKPSPVRPVKKTTPVPPVTTTTPVPPAKTTTPVPPVKTTTPVPPVKTTTPVQPAKKEKIPPMEIVVIHPTEPSTPLFGGPPLGRRGAKTEPLPPKKKGDTDVTPETTPIKSFAITNDPIGAVVYARTMLQSHADGEPLPCMTPDFIGAGGITGGGLRRFISDTTPTPPNPILRDIISMLDYGAEASDLDRWNWNNLPENSGFAIIKQEVVQTIQTAFEDIRRIGASQSEFTLWHLMTSPGVRHHFAMMVGAMLNAVPSELQYPHYQSVRQNGAVTGSRVSSGFWTQVRNANWYKQKKRWFARVVYVTSTRWTDIQKRLPNGRRLLTDLRHHFWDVFEKFDTFITMLDDKFSGDTNYSEAVADAAFLKAEIAIHKETGARLTRELEALDKVNIQLVTAKNNEINQQVADLNDAQRKLSVVTSHTMDNFVNTEADDEKKKWKRHFFHLATGLVPFTGATQSAGPIAYGPNVQVARGEIPSLIDETKSNVVDTERLTKRLRSLAAEFQQFAQKVGMWREAESIRKTIYDGLVVTSDCVSAISDLRQASRQHSDAGRAAHAMTEDEKRELVYRPPTKQELRPVRDFLQPYNVQAFEMI